MHLHAQCHKVLKSSKFCCVVQTQRFFFRKVINAVNEHINEKTQEHQESFQNWSEFQNRGFKRPEYMRSWVIEEYGSPQDVLKMENLNTPNTKITSNIDARRSYLYQAVNHPNDVLVKVHCASVNPIDVRICEGYGRRLFNFQRDVLFNTIGGLLRPFKSVQERFVEREFPLVLGRDFSGTVVDVGTRVADLQPGDEVYGAPSLFKFGTLADYVCVDLNEVAQKPATCSHIEAASIPYVGLTVVSALRNIVVKGKSPKNALVLGGSGGIGTFAIQYLQSYGYSVTTTCSTEGIAICNRLGADCIDYKTQDVDKAVLEGDKFSVVFDPIGAASPEWAGQCLVNCGSYVSLRSPIVELSDKYGPFFGFSASMSTLVKKKLQNTSINVDWAFFKPDRPALLEVARIIDGGLIKPVVHPSNIYQFEDTPKAFKKVEEGHTKGKVVVNVSGLPEAVQKPNVEKIFHL